MHEAVSSGLRTEVSRQPGPNTQANSAPHVRLSRRGVCCCLAWKLPKAAQASQRGSGVGTLGLGCKDVLLHLMTVSNLRLGGASFEGLA